MGFLFILLIAGVLIALHLVVGLTLWVVVPSIIVVFVAIAGYEAKRDARKTEGEVDDWDEGAEGGW